MNEKDFWMPPVLWSTRFTRGPTWEAVKVNVKMYRVRGGRLKNCPLPLLSIFCFFLLLFISRDKQNPWKLPPPDEKFQREDVGRSVGRPADWLSGWLEKEEKSRRIFGNINNDFCSTVTWKQREAARGREEAFKSRVVAGGGEIRWAKEKRERDRREEESRN